MPILKKSNPIHFSLTLLLIASILLVIASSPESQQGGTLFAQQDAEKTSAVGDDAKIDEIMKRMKSAGRSFRRALRANKLDEALVHIQKAQAATLETKDLVPNLIAEMEAHAQVAVDRFENLRCRPGMLSQANLIWPQIHVPHHP